MKKPLVTVLLLMMTVGCWAPAASAADEPQMIILRGLGEAGRVDYNTKTGVAIITNGFVAEFEGAVLTGDRAELDQEAGELFVEGAVTLQRQDQTWRGERLAYNFNTREIQTDRFRTGRSPFFAAGEGLNASLDGNIYQATNAYVTIDDIAQPGVRLRTKHLVIVPGKYFEAKHAVFYAGKVPIFYLPKVRYNLDGPSNNIRITPGYRSQFGAFLLGIYNWYRSESLSGQMHLDYRVKRGVGLGPDLEYNAGRWGEGQLKFYYLYDEKPWDTSPIKPGDTVPHNRDRVFFAHRTTIRSNLTAQLVFQHQRDPYVVREFLEREYGKDNQPSSTLSVQQLWQNYSLDLLVRPQVNEFFDTVERLPEIKLSGARQQIGKSPIFFETDNSFGYYQQNFTTTNGFEEYSALRADTFQQALLPLKLHEGVMFTPRAGGRYTYYGDTDGLPLEDQNRGVFNTGAELSAKASRLWEGAENKLFQVDGLRHIVQPSLNYSYTPEPNVLPAEIPQFDTRLPSLRPLPIVFPDYNSIDFIDSANVLRMVLQNRLQTKRNGKVDDLLNWALLADYRITRQPGQTRFSDLFSDLDLKLRSWLILTSEIRYDVSNSDLRLADTRVTLVPNSRWSWALGYRYVRSDLDWYYPNGNKLFTSNMYYRLNENWGFRMLHRFEAEDGIMEEQGYSIYRDFRSWTGALTFRALKDRDGPTDYGVAFTFSLKAFPQYQVGEDRNTPSLLLGG